MIFVLKISTKSTWLSWQSLVWHMTTVFACYYTDKQTSSEFSPLKHLIHICHLHFVRFFRHFSTLNCLHWKIGSQKKKNFFSGVSHFVSFIFVEEWSLWEVGWFDSYDWCCHMNKWNKVALFFHLPCSGGGDGGGGL